MRRSSLRTCDATSPPIRSLTSPAESGARVRSTSRPSRWAASSAAVTDGGSRPARKASATSTGARGGRRSRCTSSSSDAPSAQCRSSSTTTTGRGSAIRSNSAPTARWARKRSSGSAAAPVSALADGNTCASSPTRSESIRSQPVGPEPGDVIVKGVGPDAERQVATRAPRRARGGRGARSARRARSAPRAAGSCRCPARPAARRSPRAAPEGLDGLRERGQLVAASDECDTHGATLQTRGFPDGSARGAGGSVGSIMKKLLLAVLPLALAGASPAAAHGPLPAPAVEQPAKGLVYRGLEATSVGPCAGGYKVVSTSGCTHGPARASRRRRARATGGPRVRAVAAATQGAVRRRGQRGQARPRALRAPLQRPRPVRRRQGLDRRMGHGRRPHLPRQRGSAGGNRRIRFVHDAGCDLIIDNVVIGPVSRLQPRR